jgi:hypothetical protein
VRIRQQPFLNWEDSVMAKRWLASWRRGAKRALALRAPLHLEPLEERNLLAQGLVFVPSPQVASGFLSGAAAIASNDIWAVGGIFTSHGQQTLAEHFNGTSWSVVPSPSPTSNAFFSGVAGASSNDVWAVGPSLIEHWNGSSWSVVPSPTGTNLAGVTAPTSNNAWAVGISGVEHWNGTSWSNVSSPAFTGVIGFNAVSADSVNDVWAVGTASVAAGAAFTGPAALHWNGQTWSIIPAANTATHVTLRGVTALSPTNVWAAGNTSTRGSDPRFIATVEHWDGTSWSILPSPNSATHNVGTALYGIAAVSPNEIWAVGVDNSATLTEEWDGTSLKIVNSPNPGNVSNGLAGVTALGDGTVAAVGSQITSTGQTPLILQNSASAPKSGKTAAAPAASPTKAQTGTATSSTLGLHVVTSPQINGSTLNATAAIADNDFWAVGSIAGSKASDTATLAEHFDGSNWSVVATPTVKGGSFAGVAGVASNDVWAVGDQAGGNSTLIEHWNGTSWSEVPGAKVPKGSFLLGVAAVASNDVWAVGNQPGPPPGIFDSFVEHWNGTSWSLVSSPQFTAGSMLNGVAADSANDVWAVGQGNGVGLVEHWNGQAWSVVPSPTGGGNSNNRGSHLDAVTVLSPSDVWAVGSRPGPPPTDIMAGIEHWNGTNWQFVVSATPSPALLVGVAAVSANNIWAIGGLGGPIEHWDGTSWSLLATPSGVNQLSGVTALSDGTVVAVGQGSNGSAVILHN